ncbi:MAG TPA: DUF3179 domain-containing protein [Stellaceae bacterium]|nr:DUF3179 domain-containing protein [Stellaceae bacterium]
MRRLGVGLILAAIVTAPGLADPAVWRQDWPRTDFTRHSVELREIVSGGPPKDGIPPIDDPVFAPASQADDLAARAPVISLAIGGEAKAYPLRIMVWHEIVNDTIGGVAVAITWCPLCNSAVVFDRRLNGAVLSFGTTGKLRNSDLVMYDRQTESWWQQFGGDCIVGALLGSQLKPVAMRVESFGRFTERLPHGLVMRPPAGSGRTYGTNPYAGYDSAAAPILYRGKYTGRVPPLARLVVVGNEAWTLDLLKKRGSIEVGDVVLSWQPGQASPLDTAAIDLGQEIGNVVVQRKTSQGLVDAVYDESFAFAFRAFHPNGTIHAE